MDKKNYIKRTNDNFLMNVNPEEHIQQHIFWYGNYESELNQFLKRVIKPGDIFFDCGANIGYFSLLAARYGATVFAFEPVNTTFQKLIANLALNNSQRIFPIKMAVGNISGEKEIYLSGEENIGMSSFMHPENYAGLSESVQVTRLDDWIAGSDIHNIDIIKLDIEGSELSALQGMKVTLEKNKPLVISEINPETLLQFEINPSDIINFMFDLNFECYVIFDGGKLRIKGSGRINQTINVLFIHPEKKASYPDLFN